MVVPSTDPACDVAAVVAAVPPAELHGGAHQARKATNRRNPNPKIWGNLLDWRRRQAKPQAKGGKRRGGNGKERERKQPGAEG